MNHRPKRILDIRPPPRSTVALLIVALVVGAFAIPNAAVQTVERPEYLATAIMADGRDTNLQVYADRVVTDDVTYDESSHGALPSWRATLPAVPGQVIPSAPRMGWDVSFFSDVAAGVRPLRTCLEERRIYDQIHDDRTAEIGRDAIAQVFAPFAVTVTEDCRWPDLVLGANAEEDCQHPEALGCAALLDDGTRPYVRVTFNGTMRAEGRLPDRCIISVDWHEAKHSADLGHTGEYGGEGRRHPHLSDLGYMAGCRPEDNPTDEPALADWLDAIGHSFVWGLSLRVLPTPQPTPLPTPAPTQVPPDGQVDERAIWNAGYNAGFNVGFNAGWLSGYTAGYRDGRQE